MEISKNSVLIRLYIWFYCIDNVKEMGDNLCPIFWKMLKCIFILIITSPFYLLYSPFLLFKSVREDIIDYTILFIRGFILNYITFMIISVLFTVFDSEAHPAFIVGTAITISVCVILIFFFISHIIRERKDYNRIMKLNHFKEKKKSILVEGIKAFYNKHCPKITWID